MNETPRVLVVDDNAEAAELLQMLLETRGYEVRIANSGVAGLTEAAVFRPHVICTDIEMPGLSGSQLARALRESPYHSDIMIIAATGWSSNQLNSDVAAGDFDLHLMKPFALEDICVPIERHLSGSKARAGTSNSS